ncbi:MAG TPA: hypothetical protein VGF36_15425, partial [Rhodopila sp.]
ELRASGNLQLAPAPSGDPVHGEINVAYDASSGALNLGRSTVSLPHSRADFSGAINSELTVHLETTDLNDLLPVLGKSAADIPVKLSNGLILFDGIVAGDLNNPRITGHGRASNFTFSNQHVDSLEADVAASADYLRVQNATAAQGPLRAQFQGSVGLSQWNAGDASPIAGTATLRNAAVSDLAAVLHIKGLPVAGTLNGSAQVNGTIATPRADADLEVVKGSLDNQPFDRFAAHAGYAANTLTVSNGQLTEGRKQVRLSGSFQHLPGHFDTGRLNFNASSNIMPLEEIRAVEEIHPGIKGTLQVTANGAVELQPATKTGYRIDELHADIVTKGVQLAGQPLGDAHLTASSQGLALRAHLDSTIAGTAVKGDGEWRLDGDYPGSATLSFSKVDLARLKPWLTAAQGEEAARFAGSMEGTLHIEGPALNWRAMTAELRIPQFQIGPTPEADIAAEALAVKNSGPIVARFANSIITVENAHLVGRDTDLKVTGRVLTDQKNPLDLRVDGRVDLGFLRDFSKDFVSSGNVITEATVRGSLSDPQINGRLKFEKAA